MSGRAYIALRKVRTAVRFGRQQGFMALMQLVRQKLSKENSTGFLSKTKVIDFYSFVRHKPVGVPWFNGQAPRQTVNWIIPPFGYGSGGHLNIFRFVHYLEQEGFDCRIIIAGEPMPRAADQAHKQICEWFFPIKGPIYLGIDQAPPAHITVATNWYTAYYVRNFASTCHKCYFIQDFEPYFYSSGSEYAWAEETYRFGFVGITAGTWLQEKLTEDYGMVCSSFGFSFDDERYIPSERIDKNTRRVFFYARPPTTRRGFELGLLALDVLVQRLPDVQVIFAGLDVAGYDIPFAHLNAGTLSLDELPDLYSQCDVALVLSFSNLSLLPLELMACGTPVVSNRAPYTEWLLDDQNCYLAAPTVEALADALFAVLEDRELATRLREAGLRAARATDWKTEVARVGEVFRNLDISEAVRVEA